ncbi:alpha-galactosidase [Pricia antarctica]|uniref:Alpha-galactosidase n=1 Tax=Pricia antarctica TaxID=641691 RepID=A0A1G6XXT9_9FLAO|nr:alpha-galactosidase [Pricia antarctica]SDD82832.1 alpha-galactosidase [Pricia antarctica]
MSNKKKIIYGQWHASVCYKPLHIIKHSFLTALPLLCCFSIASLFGQIRNNVNAQEWLLDTDAMTYKLAVVDNKLYSQYYGKKLNDSLIIPWVERQEVAVRGGEVDKTPAIEVIFEDGTRDLDLIFSKAEIREDDGVQVLRIDLKDTYYPLLVSSYYKVLPEYDIIERWTELKNIGKKDIRIEKALSASLWLPENDYELTHFSGIWGTEFQPNTTLLTQGKKIVGSRNFKSYGSPLFLVNKQGKATEFDGEVWYGQIHYSGNWSLIFDKQPRGEQQILGGINFWDTEWTLRPDTTFKTPVFSFGYTDRGKGAVSRNYGAYVRDRILPKSHRHKIRPILYNSWYATEFDVNEKQQLALATVAKKIGVETFVIDDGWFKGRVNDKAGLGDWTVDRNKFPNGLNPLIKKINAMGMDFGIWVEPEMVNPDSDLYREHPDWVMHFENRTRTTGRNQLMLNLAREDVYEYLYEALHNLLNDHNITYLKWDMNKTLTEPGWPEADLSVQHEVRILYIENLYRLIDSLRRDFPELWIETCSSGGGRADLEIFKRTDVAWASDNIDPADRVMIQYAYLNAFPANTMVSWTGHQERHGITYDLDFHFDVSMSGVLGVGNDITKWTPAEIDLASKKITLYKAIRNTVQQGDLYRLASPFESNTSVLQYVGKDRSETVLFYYELEERLKGSTSFPHKNQIVRLKGLKKDAVYTLEDTGKKYSGSDLMEQGIAFPLNKGYSSAILRFKEK